MVSSINYTSYPSNELEVIPIRSPQVVLLVNYKFSLGKKVAASL